MTDFKSELRKILAPAKRALEDESKDYLLDGAIDDIIALFISKLPKEQKYPVDDGIRDVHQMDIEAAIASGYNQCLEDIKRASGIKGEK